MQQIHNPNKDCKPGDLLWGKNNRNKDGWRTHYIIYPGPFEDPHHLFLGAMLTHAQINGNIPMREEHFIHEDANGEKYKVTYNKSLIVASKLFKKIEWAPFTKVGELAAEGLTFVEQTIGHMDPEYYPYNAD
jgi:hypothetical protein